MGLGCFGEDGYIGTVFSALFGNGKTDTSGTASDDDGFSLERSIVG